MKKILLGLICIVLLSGCPYTSEQDINVGEKFTDKSLLGHWKLITYVPILDSGDCCSNITLLIKEGDNDTYNVCAIDSLDRVYPNCKKIRTKKFKDSKLLSIEYNLIDSDRHIKVFTYYTYRCDSDILYLTEVNNQLRGKIDSLKPDNGFKDIMPFWGTDEFVGDKYIYRRIE